MSWRVWCKGEKERNGVSKVRKAATSHRLGRIVRLCGITKFHTHSFEAQNVQVVEIESNLSDSPD